MDVQAYLKRIRCQKPLTHGSDSPGIELLRSLHRVHMFTVPFENLDIHLGRKIVCDEARFVHKIVNEHRGGFCYELNGAFAALLRALGFRVTLLSARVARADGCCGPEFDHLALRVDTPRVDLDEPWLADVGFGGSFLEPLRLESSAEQPQDGRVYRVTSSDGVFGLEVMSDGRWKREYVFTLQPRALSEFAGMCHYHQTSPESHFTRNRICSMATPEGRVTLSENMSGESSDRKSDRKSSDRKLIETRAGVRVETVISGDDEWRAKLRERFAVVLPE
jgi:N-hydroxyarylamine O-acetyltransferase